jgi:hypothetical protein
MGHAVELRADEEVVSANPSCDARGALVEVKRDAAVDDLAK